MLKKLLLIPTALFVVFLACEIGIRIYGWAPLPATYAGKSYSSLPNGRLECMNPEVSRPYFSGAGNNNPGCVFYSINNLGFRNNYPIGLKTPDLKRVAVVGDSFTYGFGVLEEDTFESKLEEMWKLEGIKVEVINAAEPAAALPEYRRILNEKVKGLSPDILIVGINLNDIMTFNSSLIIEKISRNYDWEIRKLSKLVDFFCYTMERRESSEENIKTILDSLTPERLAAFEAFVKDLKQFANTQKTELYVIVHPIFFNLENYNFTSVHEKVDSILRNEGVAFHDFLEDFKGKKSEDYWITLNDQHPNEKAHQVYFDFLFKEFGPKIRRPSIPPTKTP